MQYDKVDPKTCRSVSFCPQATPPIAVTQEDLDAVRKMIQKLSERKLIIIEEDCE